MSIGGEFAVTHHDEIIDTIRQFEQRVRAVYSQRQIVSVRAEDGLLLIDTSDVHLARDIGEALRHAYQGDLKFHFGEPDYLVRVHWQR